MKRAKSFVLFTIFALALSQMAPIASNPPSTGAKGFLAGICSWGAKNPKQPLFFAGASLLVVLGFYTTSRLKKWEKERQKREQEKVNLKHERKKRRLEKKKLQKEQIVEERKKNLFESCNEKISWIKSADRGELKRLYEEATKINKSLKTAGGEDMQQAINKAYEKRAKSLLEDAFNALKQAKSLQKLESSKEYFLMLAKKLAPDWKEGIEPLFKEVLKKLAKDEVEKAVKALEDVNTNVKIENMIDEISKLWDKQYKRALKLVEKVETVDKKAAFELYKKLANKRITLYIDLKKRTGRIRGFLIGKLYDGYAKVFVRLQGKEKNAKKDQE